LGEEEHQQEDSLRSVPDGIDYAQTTTNTHRRAAAYLNKSLHRSTFVFRLFNVFIFVYAF